MWKNRYKIYKTSDPNLLITAVRAFPNIEDTIEKANKYYEIDAVAKDEKYREIYAYMNLLHWGRDFIPIAFADRIPKLQKLQNLNPIDKSYFWCVGYVSPYLKGGAASINKPARSIDLPSFDTMLDWFKYHVKNYNSASSSINTNLFEDALRKYISENSPEKLDPSRRFNLMYNNATIISFNRDMKTEDMINHLENLKNRDFYEILVNDFK
jgi:hypothetical protein